MPGTRSRLLFLFLFDEVIRGLLRTDEHEVLTLGRALGLQQLAVELYEDQEVLKNALLRGGFSEAGRIPVYERVMLVRSL